MLAKQTEKSIDQGPVKVGVTKIKARINDKVLQLVIFFFKKNMFFRQATNDSLRTLVLIDGQHNRQTNLFFVNKTTDSLRTLVLIDGRQTLRRTTNNNTNAFKDYNIIISSYHSIIF